MNWLTIAWKVPAIIAGIMNIVEKVKGAKGAEKKAAVLAALPESIALAEFVAGRDLINDAAIQSLISIYIDAEKVAMDARQALRDGILAKAALVDVVPEVPVAPV